MGGVVSGESGVGTMSAEKPATDVPGDEPAASRAELAIEREKIQIERERLALERERLASERERWKSEATLVPRAEGRGIAVSTLVFVAVICALLGVIAGSFARAPIGGRSRSASAVDLQALVSRVSGTNAAGGGEGPIVLRASGSGGSRGAYLLILE